MTEQYDDIIDLPHHVSENRPHLSKQSRAAQFAPFAALTGYEDAVEESARLTECKAELCEDDEAELNEKIKLLSERIAGEPYCEITYFVPDKYKSGGEYLTVSGNLRFIEEASRQIVFCSGLHISIDDIVKISL